MNYDLTRQEQRIYNYLLVHRGATTREIINATYITCPSGRIPEMRKKGVPIISIGHKKYDGARAFEMYAIDVPKQTHKLLRTGQRTALVDDEMHPPLDLQNGDILEELPASEQAEQFALSMRA